MHILELHSGIHIPTENIRGPYSFSRGRIERMLCHHTQRILVMLDHADSPVGILTMGIRRDFLDIGILQVDEDNYKRGIGTSLLVRAEVIHPGITFAEGYPDSYSNIASKKTFLKAGYTENGGYFQKNILR